MNNKFGTNGSYREAREPFWRCVDSDRTLRSPDQEFETSTNYREPRDRDWVRSDGQQRGRDAPEPVQPPGGFRGRGPKGYLRSDARIREDVCERLGWNDELDATDVTVKVESGEVILEGGVETRHMKRLARDLAERVPGVIDVHNALRVKKVDDEAQRAPSAPESTRSAAGSPQAR